MATRRRPIFHLPDPYMAHYDALDAEEDRVRLETAREQRNQIVLWLWGNHRYRDAFLPGRTYGFGGDPSDDVGIRAYNLRTQLLALAGRASKPALDALLAGYYTEAFALVRTMLDAFARVTLVRLKPEEYRRWYEPDDGADGPDENINIGLTDGAVRSRGTVEDRRVFREVNLRFKLLSEGAHPSGVAITQMLGPYSDKGLFGPHYIRQFCEHGFNHGVYVHTILLQEVARLGHHDGEWLASVGSLADHFEPDRLAMQPVLDEREREEKERKARRRASVPGQHGQTHVPASSGPAGAR